MGIPKLRTFHLSSVPLSSFISFFCSQRLLPLLPSCPSTRLPITLRFMASKSRGIEFLFSVPISKWGQELTLDQWLCPLGWDILLQPGTHPQPISGDSRWYYTGLTWWSCDNQMGGGGNELPVDEGHGEDNLVKDEQLLHE